MDETSRYFPSADAKRRPLTTKFISAACVLVRLDEVLLDCIFSVDGKVVDS